MNTNQMTGILSELSKPFHPSHVTFKPGVFNRDKSKALALAYADLRAYQSRLDEVAGMDWSVTYTPWGDRLVCHLTICGVTRSSTGEPDSQSEKSEIAGTAAEAQAFKRACAMFGLGRYLYNLPTVWAEFDGDRRQWTEAGKARLQGIITSHYQRHCGEEGLQTEQPAPERKPQPAQPHLVGNPLVAEFNELGEAIYGAQWPSVKRHNVERISEGKATSDEQMTEEQLKKLISGLKKLQRQRQPA